MSTPSDIVAILKVVAVIAFVVVIAIIGGQVKKTIDGIRETKAALSTTTATARATETTANAISAVQAETQRVEVVVTQGRAATVQAIQELTNADPSIATLRATPIPDSLRNIARQRREARDGLTTTGNGR